MIKLKGKQKSIGVFDSGFGGINILRGIVRELPEYNYLYLGDTARTPYGTRSREIVYEFTKQAIDFMFANGCELVILACNTASSDALRKLQQEYLPKRYPGKKILGVLVPATEAAVDSTRNRRVGIIATEGTVKSNAFVDELIKLDSGIKVFQNACPLLVPIVEAGEQNSKAAKLILEAYIKPLKKKNVDTLILGCTHYGILERRIKEAAGSNITIVSEAIVVPRKLKLYFARHPEIESVIGKKRSIRFYTTDLTDKFTTLGSKFFGRAVKAEKITL
nr:glutamate racemase [Candidatus Undinarchaeales archaeon ERR594346 U_76725]